MTRPRSGWRARRRWRTRGDARPGSGGRGGARAGLPHPRHRAAHPRAGGAADAGAPARPSDIHDIERLIDERMMRHALALGRRGLGNTWPNPAVGAVVWRMEGGAPIILGRGWTQPGGRPHAETVALAQAG